MHILQTLVFSLISLPAALAVPLAAAENSAEAMSLKLAPRANSGVETISGLGTRKKAITALGGTTLDLAIAMLETNNMIANYKYGDSKIGDAANFGVFRQNWLMIRTCGPSFKGQTSSQWNNGAKLNTDLSTDIATRHACQSYYGYDKWMGGHRNGQAGLDNPSTTDIGNYKAAVEAIQKLIESDPKYLTDDTRFWNYVVAI